MKHFITLLGIGCLITSASWANTIVECRTVTPSSPSDHEIKVKMNKGTPELYLDGNMTRILEIQDEVVTESNYDFVEMIIETAGSVGVNYSFSPGDVEKMKMYFTKKGTALGDVYLVSLYGKNNTILANAFNTAVPFPCVVQTSNDERLLNKKITEAIESQNIDEVRTLLERGANPNSAPGGEPLLTLAASLADYSNALEISKLLLDAGADVNKPGDQWSTAILEAGYKGNIELVKYFKQRGADLAAYMRLTSNRQRGLIKVLMMSRELSVENKIAAGKWAVENGTPFYPGDVVTALSNTYSKDFLEYLLGNGGSLDDKTVYGTTVITPAILSLDLKLVEYVLEQGNLDVNEPQEHGFGPLMILSRRAVSEESDKKKQIAIAELLLKKGADINFRNNGAMVSAFSYSQHLVPLFVKSGGLLNDVQKSSAVVNAVKSNNRTMLEYLVTTMKADINGLDEVNESAVFAASSSGDLETLKYLVEKYKAKVNVVSRYGKTPLEYAQWQQSTLKKDRKAIIEYLVSQEM